MTERTVTSRRLGPRPINAFACAWWLLLVPALRFPAVRGANLTLLTMNWTRLTGTPGVWAPRRCGARPLPSASAGGPAVRVGTRAAIALLNGKRSRVRDGNIRQYGITREAGKRKGTKLDQPQLLAIERVAPDHPVCRSHGTGQLLSWTRYPVRRMIRPGEGVGLVRIVQWRADEVERDRQ